ncbi:MAG: glycosyltransferase family 4 protein [Cyanobacteria bacterium P01_F01_bin.42]
MLQNFEASKDLVVLNHTPKILFYVTRYWPAIAGASLHTRKLIQCLSSDYPVGVIRHSGDEPVIKEIAFARNPTLTLTDGVTPIHQLGAAKQLRWLLEPLATHYPSKRWSRPLFNAMLRLSIRQQVESISRSYDIVHAVYTGMTASVRLAQRVAKRQRKPFVLTPLIHINNPNEKVAKSLRTLFVNSDVVIAMTEIEKEWLVRQGVNRNCIHVCPYGPLISPSVKPRQFRQRYQLSNYPVVLFIARQIPEKGYHPLALSAQRVWEKYPTTRFVFIGPKTEDSKSFFEEIRDPRILNLGEVSDEIKSSALAACDIFCLPSHQESLGVSYLEAWEFEKPVIAANIPVMPSMIEHGKDGLIVEPVPSTIAAGITQLLDQPALRHELGCSGYRKVRSHYDWQQLSARMGQIYRQLKRMQGPLTSQE